jgi:hypothetical protein
MNDPQDLLAQLRGIHEPPPVSWWPPAPGWWLAGAALLLTIVIAVWLIRQRRAMAMHAAALRRIDEIARNYQQTGDSAQLAQAVSILLRRFAVNTFPERDVGGLHGDQWLEFLDNTGGDGEFVQQHRASLLEAPYRRDAQVDGEALLRSARRWLRKLPQAKLRGGATA